MGEAGLRAFGLTRQKARYCHGLATRVAEGGLNLSAVAALPDAAGRSMLLSVPGLGPWSVDIYYLMALRRPDVWPEGRPGAGLGASRGETDAQAAKPRKSACHCRALVSLALRGRAPLMGALPRGARPIRAPFPLIADSAPGAAVPGSSIAPRGLCGIRLSSGPTPGSVTRCPGAGIRSSCRSYARPVGHPWPRPRSPSQLRGVSRKGYAKTFRSPGTVRTRAEKEEAGRQRGDGDKGGLGQGRCEEPLQGHGDCHQYRRMENVHPKGGGGEEPCHPGRSIHALPVHRDEPNAECDAEEGLPQGVPRQPASAARRRTRPSNL